MIHFIALQGITSSKCVHRSHSEILMVFIWMLIPDAVAIEQGRFKHVWSF
jgi:hypothetical protein